MVEWKGESSGDYKLPKEREGGGAGDQVVEEGDG